MAKKTQSKASRDKGTKRSKAPVTKMLKKKRRPTVPAPAPAQEIRLPAGKRFTKSPLSKAELEEFRQMLIAKRRALVGDMTNMEAEALRTNRQEGTGDLSKIPTHDADVGTDNFEQEFTLGLLESERVLLNDINDALERIEKGIYGICEGTGLAIGKSRLKARPWARYCIEYARMIEKGLVPRGREGEQSEEEVAEDLEPVEEEEANDEGEDDDSASEE